MIKEDVPDGEWWANGQHDAPEAPALTISENPEVGRLYAPDGSLLRVVRARAVVPFGFRA